MPRRRSDGTFQRVLPLETWPEKAHQAGYLAGLRGQPEAANPYLVRTSMRSAWEHGRQSAFCASRATDKALAAS